LFSPIRRTRQADEDLIAIWLGIAKDDPAAADRVLDAIERRWQQLADFPYSGVAREDIAPGIRHLVAGRYLTLYRVIADRIEIIRILHGRRKLEADPADPKLYNGPADSITKLKKTLAEGGAEENWLMAQEAQNALGDHFDQR